LARESGGFPLGLADSRWRGNDALPREIKKKEQRGAKRIAISIFSSAAPLFSVSQGVVSSFPRQWESVGVV
jgi:hypothetical protein